MGAGSSYNVGNLNQAAAQLIGEPRTDGKFWTDLWTISASMTREDVWKSFSLDFLRDVKTKLPFNFCALITQCLNRMSLAVFSEAGVPMEEHKFILIAVRILTRCLTVLMEDGDNGHFLQQFMWQGLVPVPANHNPEQVDLMQKALRAMYTGSGAKISMLMPGVQVVRLLTAVLFIPEFTMMSPEVPEDDTRHNLQTGGFVHVGKMWFNGVGPNNAQIPVSYGSMDSNRTEILQCLLTVFTAPIYAPVHLYSPGGNRFISEMVSEAHTLAPTLFYCLINCICSYDPNGWVTGTIPFTNNLFADDREQLVETATCLLSVCLDNRQMNSNHLLVLPSDVEQMKVYAAQQATLKRAETKSLLIGVIRKSSVSSTRPSASLRSSTASPPSPTSSSSSSPLPTPPSSSSSSSASTSEEKQVAGSRSSSAQSSPQGSPSMKPLSPQAGEVPSDGPKPTAGDVAGQALLFQNVFRRIVLHELSTEDLRIFFHGVCDLLCNPMQVDNAYLPYGYKRLSMHAELLILAWQLLDDNDNFLMSAFETNTVVRLVQPLVYYIYESASNPARIGVLFSCVFILLRLTGEREFCVALNEAYHPKEMYMPKLRKMYGNYHDLLVSIVSYLIFKFPGTYTSIHNVLLTILSNISPYMNKSSQSTANTVIMMLSYFSNPQTLYTNETQHECCSLLLDFFNNVLQYQYVGNPGVAYAVVTNQSIFYDLARPVRIKVKEAAVVAPLPVTMAPTDAVPSSGEAEKAADSQKNEPPKRPFPYNKLDEKIEDQKNLQAAIAAENGQGSGGEASALAASAGAAGVEKKSVDVLIDDEDPDMDMVEVDMTNDGQQTAVAAGTTTTAGAAAPAGQGDVEMKQMEGTQQPQAQSQVQSQSQPLAAPLVKRFVPTMEWVQSWKPRLQVETCLRLCRFLAPKVKKFTSENADIDTMSLSKRVGEVSIIGVLPVPHSIIVRKYVTNASTNMWFTAYFWGLVFLKFQRYPLFAPERIKMFKIASAPQ